MSDITNHLSKLTCAARQANDYGYVHTSKALQRLISDERERLRLAHLKVLPFGDCHGPSPDYVAKDTRSITLPSSHSE